MPPGSIQTYVLQVTLARVQTEREAWRLPDCCAVALEETLCFICMMPQRLRQPTATWRYPKRFFFNRAILWLVCLPAAVVALPLLLTLSFPDLVGGARSKQPLLLVAAHPDDETIMFGPGVVADRPAAPRPSLLCLSTGHDRGILDLRNLSNLELGHA